MTQWRALELNVQDKVAEIRLSRPELLNRFDMILHREMTDVLGQLAEDKSVLAVVLSSTGRYFSAGGDTEVMVEAADDIAHRLTMLDEGRRLFRAVADFPKPLVVALHGNSYGLGTSLILAADAIVSTPTVELSDPHVRMALVAGDGGVVSWPSAMGMVRAKRHLLTGDPMTAAEAHRLGVVTDLVDTQAEVLPTAQALAQRIAQLPPLAVQLTKRALNKVLMTRTEEVLDLSFYLEGVTMGSEDMREAIAAFKEKRPGSWKGR
ncbi:MAG: enoyl-CoA hydratase/isomerase family protein [Steroidobacteraceae bacterium]